MARSRRTYTDEFKTQVVNLFLNGKPRAEIIREYELTPSALNNWIKRFSDTGTVSHQDTRTPEEIELQKLRKRNKQLEMENDILKQAALIFGRKGK